MEALRKLNGIARFIWFALGHFSAVLLTLALIIVTYTAIRGLPEEFQSLLRAEFRQRGLYVDWDFIGLDPKVRLSVKNFRCRGVIPGRESAVVIEQALIDIGWLSFARGEQILKGMSISNAYFQFITDGGDKLNIDKLDTRLILTAEKIILQEFLASSGRAVITVEGEIPLRFFETPSSDNTPDIGPDPRQTTSTETSHFFEEYAKKLLNALDQAALVTKIDISPRPGKGWDAVAVKLSAKAFTQAQFQGICWEDLSLLAHWDRRSLFLNRLFLKTHIGSLSVSGYWKPEEHIMSAELYINTPPESLLPLLPANIVDRLNKVTTHGSFLLEALINLNTKFQQQTSAHGRLEWIDVTLGSGRVEEIVVPFHLLGTQLQVPTAKIEAGKETLEITISSPDIRSILRANFIGSLNPARLKHMLPELEGFFNSTKFGSPVQLNLSADFFPSQVVNLKMRGRLSIANLIYKQVEILSLSSELELSPPFLRLTNLRLQRPEGIGTAQRVEYDYKIPSVRLSEVRTNFSTIPTARIFGPKLEEYLLPYIFSSPPEILLNGFIDLASEKKTDLKIFASGKDFTYRLLGREMRGRNFTTQINLRANRLEISTLNAILDEGDLALNGSFLLQPNNTSYELAFALRDADFSSLMRGFFNLDNITGRITGNANLSGKLEDLRSMRGQGQVSVREGSLIDIPFLGALSQVAGLIELGKARASEADATFQIENGKIFTSDLDIRSVTMALIGNGHYDFVDDQMQLDVRLNVRGPAGLVLFPVSKLFEYRGTGSLANTKWEPKMFTPAVPIPGSAQGISPSVRGRNR